jgi:hypothetical protein
MIDYSQKLIDWCRPIESGYPFFRPLVSKCRWEEIDTFLVGLNPATSIYESDCSLDEYTSSLVGNYELFEEIYWSKRGKPEGRTRIGINAFQEWLSTQMGCGIAETNVITYPTKSSEELKYPSLARSINHSREIFRDLLCSLKPKFIIVHGSKAKNEFVPLLKRSGMIRSDNWLEKSSKELEKSKSILQIQYCANQTGIALACRSLMYYGKLGNSFEEFRDFLRHLK